MGDNDAAHDNMVVKANGKVMLADVDTAAGTFAVNTFVVTVSSGSLTLQFLDAGGADSVWVVNGVSIATSSQPPVSCDRAQFIADITVPDGTVYPPGTAFTKTWRLKNVGTCTWTTFYAMIFDTGEKMGGPDLVNLPQSVAPGQTVDMSINMTAPGTAGPYRGYWRFQNSDGVPFGIGAGGAKSWWVDIRVSGTPPASCSDRAQFITDVTVPDGTVYAPGTAFLKTWRLKNVGTCTWTTTYAMVFDSGEKMGSPDSVGMPQAVSPGSSVDVSVSMNAPITAGSYRGFWTFENASGARFGIGADATRTWWVDIKVVGVPPSSTPTFTPTASPTPTTTPATPTPIPGLIVRGYVRLQDGSGLPGVTICRSFAAYSGVIVATTDANGYFQSDFTFIPGDEMVRVWPSLAGYSFQPDSGYWRHYYGPEDRSFNFVATPGSPAATPPAPCP